MHTFTFEGDGPERLDRFLIQRIEGTDSQTELSRSQLKLWIEAGKVTVDGKPVLKAGTPIKPGALVQMLPFTLPPQDLTPYDFKLDIIFEDQHMLVINKPRRLSMHPGAGNRDQTLANAVVHHCGLNISEVGGAGRAGIVHRLDKDTSGLVVVAKDIVTHRALQAQFAERSVGRAYLALALTTPRSGKGLDTQDHGTIEGAIARDPKNRLRMTVTPSGGKPATTHWKVLERFNHGILLELKLGTGRTHQIRAHLFHVGSPVIGDQVYGETPDLPAKLSRAADEFGSQALHAAKLEFTHPANGERKSFEAQPPQDFLALVELWREFKG